MINDIFGGIKINGLKGFVLVADSYVENGDLKSTIAIDFSQEIGNTALKKLTDDEARATINIEWKDGVKYKLREVSVCVDCDYTYKSIARVFLVIKNYEKLSSLITTDEAIEALHKKRAENLEKELQDTSIKITKKMKYKALREFVLIHYFDTERIKKVIEVLDNTSVIYFTPNKKEALKALKSILKQTGE